MRTNDPLLGLPSAVGDVLVRHRKERKWTVEALATASGLSPVEIVSMEDGSYSPVLLDLVRIARALGVAPAILLCDVIAAWRADSVEILHRAHDFARLFRLGYHHNPRDFRELATSYYSVAEATHAAATLNAQRCARGEAALDTVCMYLRLDYVSLRSDSSGQEGAT
jgi:transcriptional regulator with XRE-family HTH domain